MTRNWTRCRHVLHRQSALVVWLHVIVVWLHVIVLVYLTEWKPLLLPRACSRETRVYCRTQHLRRHQVQYFIIYYSVFLTIFMSEIHALEIIYLFIHIGVQMKLTKHRCGGNASSRIVFVISCAMKPWKSALICQSPAHSTFMVFFCFVSAVMYHWRKKPIT